jgi:hypothetical protein
MQADEKAPAVASSRRQTPPGPAPSPSPSPCFTLTSAPSWRQPKVRRHENGFGPRARSRPRDFASRPACRWAAAARCAAGRRWGWPSSRRCGAYSQPTVTRSGAPCSKQSWRRSIARPRVPRLSIVRTRSGSGPARLDELIPAISDSTMVSLDPSLIPPGQADNRPPTSAMLSFAVSLAGRKGETLPCGCKSSISICRSFLDTHAGPRVPQTDGAGEPRDRRIPSAAMLRCARSLAEQRGIPCV